jgi:hypothetical protein
MPPTALTSSADTAADPPTLIELELAELLKIEQFCALTLALPCARTAPEALASRARMQTFGPPLATARPVTLNDPFHSRGAK